MMMMMMYSSSTPIVENFDDVGSHLDEKKYPLNLLNDIFSTKVICLVYGHSLSYTNDLFFGL